MEAARSRASRARRPATAGSIVDLFLRRLAALEARVAGELERPARAGSPLGSLFLDIARETWRLAGDSAAALARPAAVVGRVAGAGSTDEFGVDHDAAERLRELIRPLARLWLGMREQADVRPPERGGVLVLCNRSAWPLGLEALVVHAAVAERFGAGRPTYVLWERGAGELPFVADAARRVGLLEASTENCRLLLERGAFVVAFPEGEAALTKTYDRRYRLARFAAAGLVGAAMRAGAAVVPAALVGNEESFPLLARPAGWPLTLQFPLAGAAGLLPLPLAWTLRLGAAVSYARDDDGPLAEEAVGDAVRERMQALVADVLAARRSLVYG